MIPNRQNRLSQVTSIITGNISQINALYPGGPALYFYHRVIALRQQHHCVASFLACDTCVEMMYATLVSWGMNSRAAKLKDYGDFRSNINSNAAGFQSVEAASSSFTWANRASVVQALTSLYASLSLMKSGGKLVSNSKCLHLVFPILCLPMDTVNTLQKLYGSISESQARFVEVLEFSYDAIAIIPNPQLYFDNQWNTCETKLVDNAIFLM